MKKLQSKEQFISAVRMILEQESDGDFENAVLTVYDLAVEHNQWVDKLVQGDYTPEEFNTHLCSYNIILKIIDTEKLIWELENE